MIKRTKKMNSDTIDITVFTAALLLVMTMCSLGMFFQTTNELFGTTLALSFTVSLAVLFTAGVDLVCFDDREDELLYVMRRFCSGFGWFGKAQKYIKRAALLGFIAPAILSEFLGIVVPVYSIVSLVLYVVLSYKEINEMRKKLVRGMKSMLHPIRTARLIVCAVKKTQGQLLIVFAWALIVLPGTFTGFILLLGILPVTEAATGILAFGIPMSFIILMWLFGKTRAMKDFLSACNVALGLSGKVKLSTLVLLASLMGLVSATDKSLVSAILAGIATAALLLKSWLKWESTKEKPRKGIRYLVMVELYTLKDEVTSLLLAMEQYHRRLVHKRKRVPSITASGSFYI